MDWFAAGAQLHDYGATAAPLPPLNDMEAQRHWLAGFGAAWVDRPDALSLDDALLAALRSQEALLRQLRAHGLGRTTRTLQ
jgi:hypothetical protein